jgi:hypothetical protein
LTVSWTRAPVPTSADARLAAAAIWDRHHREGDEHLGLLDPADLWSVNDYVARYYRSVRPSVRALDALDVLVIHRYLRRQLDLRDRNMITLARQWKTPWRAIAAALGVASRQAALALYERLLAWSEPFDRGIRSGGPRSEVAYRQYRAELAAGAADPETMVAFPSPRDPAPVTVSAVVELLRRLYERHRDIPEDLVLDLAAAINSPNPAHTLGLVRSVVAELVDRAGELPGDLADLARDADATLRH